MSDKRDIIPEVRDGYRWVSQMCPICDKKPSRFVGRRGGNSHRAKLGVEAEIWKCVDCGLLFPDPMPVPVGGLSQHYAVPADEYFEHHEKEGKDAGAAALVQRAEELLGRKGKLLDVGVGRGEVLIAAAESGWEAEGVEPSGTFADFAQRRTGAKIWRESVEESNIQDNSYDVVILAAVLEHLYDPNAVIAKISQALKPGGFLYLDVPNESGLYFKVGNAYQWIRGRDWTVNLAPTFPPFHVFGFSPRALKKLLAKHDLRPKLWTIYSGTSLVPQREGLMGSVERTASSFVTKLSAFGEMGTYIETWAERVPR